MLWMTLPTSKHRFGVEFYHDREADVTECTIYEYAPTSQVVLYKYRGVAYCHAKDTFCKESGRKISFTRAIMHDFNREERRALWQQYFARKKG